MTTKRLRVNDEIEMLLDRKGFKYVITQVNRWVFNKIELFRHFCPKEKDEIQTLRVVSVKLRDVIERYNQPT